MDCLVRMIPIRAIGRIACESGGLRKGSEGRGVDGSGGGDVDVEIEEGGEVNYSSRCVVYQCCRVDGAMEGVSITLEEGGRETDRIRDSR
jgi:hypothetical protein